MTGWGAKHAAELEVVQSTTNLTLAQIKVSFFSSFNEILVKQL